MIQLQIIKQIPYLSYSSFKEALNCEYGFYLNRCSGFTLPRLPQTEQMAVGSAFDAFVKSEIARLLGKPYKLAQLLDKSVEPQNSHMIKEANLIFTLYEEQGQVKKLLDEGIEDIELDITESIHHVDVQGIKSLIAGVTIFGRLDAAIKGQIPLDWKVNGWGSKTGQSPKKGYQRAIYLKKGSYVETKQHIDASSILMEEIDQDWATQLLFYWWLFDKSNTLPKSVAIEQVAIRQDTIVFASYRAKVGGIFAKFIWEQLTDIWERFLEGKFKEPEPDLFKCEPLNNPRACTLECKAYKETLGDPVKRAVLVAQKLR